MFRRERPLIAAFCLIPLAFMAAVMIAPALGGVAKSFDANAPSFSNSREIFRDPTFLRALLNNLVVPAGSLVIEFAAGLGLALFLTSSSRPSAVVEAAAIFPFAIPEIVLLTLARFIFAPRGYLNGALVIAGASPMHWIEPNHTLKYLTVMMVDAWHVTPVVMLILMAGIATIPNELYEAARLDGAGRWATFRYVTLPMLMPALIAALVLRGV